MKKSKKANKKMRMSAQIVVNDADDVEEDCVLRTSSESKSGRKFKHLRSKSGSSSLLRANRRRGNSDVAERERQSIQPKSGGGGDTIAHEQDKQAVANVSQHSPSNDDIILPDVSVSSDTSSSSSTEQLDLGAAKKLKSPRKSRRGAPSALGSGGNSPRRHHQKENSSASNGSVAAASLSQVATANDGAVVGGAVDGAAAKARDDEARELARRIDKPFAEQWTLERIQAKALGKYDGYEMTKLGPHRLNVLAMAADYGRLDVVEWLVKVKSVDANQKDSRGWTALHHACMRGELDTCLYLMEHGALVEQVTNQGLTEMHLLVSGATGERYSAQKERQVIKQFVLHGADLWRRTEHTGSTAVHHAAGSGRVETLAWLMQFDRGLAMSRNSAGDTCLESALLRGQGDAVRYLTCRRARGVLDAHSHVDLPSALTGAQRRRHDALASALCDIARQRADALDATAAFLVDSPTLCRVIIEATPQAQIEEVAEHLLAVFHQRGRALELVRLAVDVEIERCTEKSLFFRGTGMPSKLYSKYVKLVGDAYLRATLLPTIEHVAALERPLEIDPAKFSCTPPVVSPLVATRKQHVVVASESPQENASSDSDSNLASSSSGDDDENDQEEEKQEKEEEKEKGDDSNVAPVTDGNVEEENDDADASATVAAADDDGDEQAAAKRKIDRDQAAAAKDVSESDERVANADQLRKVCQSLVDSILGSADILPADLKSLLAHIQRSSLAKFGDSFELLSGVLFLRFLTPALTSPQRFDLIFDDYSRAARRTTILVAKLIQSLANEQDLSDQHHGFWTEFAPFVAKNAPSTRQFFEQLIADSSSSSSAVAAVAASSSSHNDDDDDDDNECAAISHGELQKLEYANLELLYFYDAFHKLPSDDDTLLAAVWLKELRKQGDDELVARYEAICSAKHPDRYEPRNEVNREDIRSLTNVVQARAAAAEAAARMAAADAKGKRRGFFSGKRK
jgi:GTPase-activator protein for Ras-like GTPase/Ankyrin repeats (3 copies)